LLFLCIFNKGALQQSPSKTPVKYIQNSLTAVSSFVKEVNSRTMKDLNISFIRYYVTLVECKKFNKAAEALHLSQPALSKSIMQLEEHLGVALLKRYPKGFDLTDAGKYFYETSTYFLKLYDEFMYDIDSRVNSLYSGTVRMSASGVLLEQFFPDLLVKLRESYPTIRLFFKAEDTSSAVQSLLTHKVDLATAIAPIPQKLKGNFTVCPVMSTVFHVVMPKDHPLAQKSVVSVKDLDKVCLLVPGESSQATQSFLAHCRDHCVQPEIVCATSQFQLLIKLTELGCGLSIQPAVFLRNLPESLVHRPLSPKVSWELQLISPNNTLSLAAATVISFMKSYFDSLSSSNSAH